jgi:DNA adenine methylase
VAEALRAPGVRLVRGSFEAARDVAAPGDFLYFDPPYAPLSRTSNFTAYTAGKFGGADQRRLQRTILELAQRGCGVLLSNSTAEEVVQLYECEEAHAAGLRTIYAAARRAINRDPAKRGAIAELIVTNVCEKDPPAVGPAVPS